MKTAAFLVLFPFLAMAEEQAATNAVTELAAEKPAPAFPAPVLSPKMIYIQRGSIESKNSIPRGDNFTTIRFEGVAYTIINHPSYFDLALGEPETCIIVRGQVDQATGRRLYHYFSENTMTEADIANFKKRWPGVALD